MKWHAIDTAPQDGTVFLGWSTHHGPAETKWLQATRDDEESVWWDIVADDDYLPTLWTPDYTSPAS